MCLDYHQKTWMVCCSEDRLYSLMQVIQQWVEKFQKKYPSRGTLIGPYFDSEGNPTPTYLALQQQIFDFRRRQHPDQPHKMDFLVNQQNLKRYKFQASPIPDLEQNEVLVQVCSVVVNLANEELDS